MCSSFTRTEGRGWFPVGASIAHTVRALARLYLPSSPFFTSPLGPHLTASHVVDALETRSQYIDQSISKRMILPPQLSPVSELQVLCPPCLHEHLPTPCSLLPHLPTCPSSRFAVSAHSPTTPTLSICGLTSSSFPLDHMCAFGLFRSRLLLLLHSFPLGGALSSTALGVQGGLSSALLR